MNDPNNLKSKIKRLILCAIIFFIVKFIFHHLFPVIPISELGPASALPPIFGLMFGSWGAAGAAFGYLASDILAGSPPEIYILNFFIQFLYAYIPYKLWYTLDMEKTISLPRLDTVRNLIKFVVIMFINAAVMAGLLGFLMDALGLYDFVSLTTIVFAFNNFDFTIMFGTLIITAANYYNIRMLKPSTIKKPSISPRVFDVIAIIAIITAVANAVYAIFSEPDIWSWLAWGISYLLVLIYVLRPVTKEISEKTTKIKISLTEKLIIIFIIIGAIMALVMGFRSFHMMYNMGLAELRFWESVYVNITLILSVFYISFIGFLWYIEKSVTTPIESISDLLKNYISGSKGIENDATVLSKCELYSTEKSEVGILALSFKKMIRDLKAYIKNLEIVTAEKERINAELNVAQKIQADMLPRKFPAFPERDEFDVYATNIPAKEVGGDFYDFFLIDDSHLAIVIADVSGKGVPAALFMVIAKTLIKNQAQLGKSPAEVFTIVNNQLCEGNEESMFVTAWMGILEIETGKFTYVNAGHNSPLLKRKNDDYDWLKSKAGFVLAGMEDIQYNQKQIILEPGDRVYLYTDGVTEAINCDDELFGDSRLLEIMKDTNDLSLTDLVFYVKSKIDAFVEDREQFDDITMLVMEYKK